MVLPSAPLRLQPSLGTILSSDGVDRALCVPCQLRLVGSAGGAEALTGSDGRKSKPGPVHQLSAHAQWRPDGAAQLPAHV